MKRTLTVLAALLALTGTTAAQVVIQQPPIVVTPPPIVVTPPPIVVAPPPVIVAPPPVLLPPPPPPPPPLPVCIVVGPPWVWLNLRVFPNGQIVGALPPGTALALLNVSGNWGFVQSPIGTGWAFLPYTTCN
jgi:hypothetical protein